MSGQTGARPVRTGSHQRSQGQQVGATRGHHMCRCSWSLARLARAHSLSRRSRRPSPLSGAGVTTGLGCRGQWPHSDRQQPPGMGPAQGHHQPMAPRAATGPAGAGVCGLRLTPTRDQTVHQEPPHRHPGRGDVCAVGARTWGASGAGAWGHPAGSTTGTCEGCGSQLAGAQGCR